ncbi:MAG: threonine--tRNA ligase [Bacteroidota bacterium]
MGNIRITLPDGSKKEYPSGITLFEIARSISSHLAEEALAAIVDGKAVDLSTHLFHDATVRILTFDDPEGREVYWHSTSHLMAHAVEDLFPGAKFGVGPAIDEGFYYDIDVDKQLVPEDLAQIEKRMLELSKKDEPFEREELTKEAALKLFSEKQDPYKVEILNEIDQSSETVSIYREGNFVDLCRGPHVPSTGKLKNFKLLSVSSSYWRGDSKNKTLQRIYGISFPKKSDLDDYLHRLEEAKRRDHRRLGKELELFVFHEVSPGAPFWLPNGMIIYRELEKFLREELDRRGYQEISTPILVKKDLWEQSGHWTHYKENMFLLEVDDEIYSLKPMNCPESTFVYRQKVRSYRELPLRYSEIGRLHRNEISGALGGMFRVRQITMDDAHIYCRPDQILSEIGGLLDLVLKFYSLFGFSSEFNLSTKPEKAMGDPALWEKAERALAEALEEKKIAYQLKPGEGAFYGPKIDVQIKDVLGRSWQLATIQLDFQMPERFGLEYVDEAGKRVRPVMIHRAIFGSFERFVGILTEHFGGAFPLWLSPVQVVVIPITEGQYEYAEHVLHQLQSYTVRVQLDDRNEKINYKIREWEVKKVPYMLILGEKEKNTGTVSVRQHGKGDRGVIPTEQFVKKIVEEIETKVLTT